MRYPDGGGLTAERRAAREGIRLEGVCGIFGVSRSGFYRWRAAEATRAARAAAEADLTEQIRGIHTETKGAYGVPRVTRELRE